MLRHFTVINIFLILLLIAGVFITYRGFVDASNVEVKISDNLKLSSEDSEKLVETPRQSLSLAEYTVINERNLFHPDRISVEVEPEATPETAVKKPEVVVFGTIVADEYRVAIVETPKKPRSTAGRGRRQTTVRQGDTIEGFTVKEIAEDYIVLVKGAVEYTIKVQHSSKYKHVTPPPAVKAPKKAPPVKKRTVPKKIKREKPPVSSMTLFRSLKK